MSRPLNRCGDAGSVGVRMYSPHLAILIVDPVWWVIDAGRQLHALALDLIRKGVGAPFAAELAQEVIGCWHVACIAELMPQACCCIIPLLLIPTLAISASHAAQCSLHAHRKLCNQWGHADVRPHMQNMRIILIPIRALVKREAQNMGSNLHTWVHADVSRAVIADLIHVQPEAVKWRNAVQALCRQYLITTIDMHKSLLS